MKRFLTLVLTILLALSCFGIVACKHEHNFDQKVTKAIYRKSIATCGTSAVYYKSCSCGEMGTETFNAGGPLGHNYVNRECTRCHDVTATSNGLIFRSISDDTCIVFNVGFCLDKDIVIPAENDGQIVVGINNDVFKENDGLESIFIPSSITNIGKNAFSGCNNLKTVTIPSDSKLTTISESAFEHCNNLTDIVMPSSLKSIGRAAFKDCIKLEEINLPSSLKDIGIDAFANCASLKSLDIPNGVESIGDTAFKACNTLKTVTIPNSVTEIGTGVFAGCVSLTRIDAPGNQNFKTIDGDLYTKDGKTLLQYSIGKTENKFVVPDGVTKIEEQAFYSCRNLISITLSKDLKTISNDAFSFCDNLFEVYNLSTLKIQMGDIGNGSVAYNAYDVYTSDKTASKLSVENQVVLRNNAQEILLLGYLGLDRELIIPAKVTQIKSGAFQHNEKLEIVSIPNTVKTIGEFAFGYCGNLKSIIINKGLTKIEMYAFIGCSALESINFIGTKAEWNNIEKGFSWNFSTGNKYKVICSDGTI